MVIDEKIPETPSNYTKDHFYDKNYKILNYFYKNGLDS